MFSRQRLLLLFKQRFKLAAQLRAFFRQLSRHAPARRGRVWLMPGTSASYSATAG